MNLSNYYSHLETKNTVLLGMTVASISLSFSLIDFVVVEIYYKKRSIGVRLRGYGFDSWSCNF